MSLQAKTNEAIAAISNEPIAEDSALGDIDLVLWIQEIRRTLCLDFRAREGIVRAVLTLWEIEGDEFLENFSDDYVLTMGVYLWVFGMCRKDRRRLGGEDQRAAEGVAGIGIAQ